MRTCSEIFSSKITPQEPNPIHGLSSSSSPSAPNTKPWRREVAALAGASLQLPSPSSPLLHPSPSPLRRSNSSSLVAWLRSPAPFDPAQGRVAGPPTPHLRRNRPEAAAPAPNGPAWPCSASSRLSARLPRGSRVPPLRSPAGTLACSAAPLQPRPPPAHPQPLISTGSSALNQLAATTYTTAEVRWLKKMLTGHRSLTRSKDPSSSSCLFRNKTGFNNSKSWLIRSIQLQMMNCGMRGPSRDTFQLVLPSTLDKLDL